MERSEEIDYELHNAEAALDRCEEALVAKDLGGLLVALQVAAVHVHRVDDVGGEGLRPRQRELLITGKRRLNEVTRSAAGKPRVAAVERYVGRVARVLVEQLPSSRVSLELARTGLVVTVQVWGGEKRVTKSHVVDLVSLEGPALAPARQADRDAARLVTEVKGAR